MAWLGLVDLIVCSVVIVFGATLQAATGLGAGLVIVPLLALVSMELVPAPVILAGLPLSWLMAFAGRRHIQLTKAVTVMGGLAVGMVMGGVLLSITSWRYLGLLYAVLIWVAVAISMAGMRIAHTTWPLLGAGVLSGFMGTTAAVGAPILALLYQFEKGPVIRASLGFYYFVSSVVMLLVLYTVGRFGWHDFGLGLQLIPAFLLGYALSGYVVVFVDRGRSRWAILLIAMLSAMILFVKTLFY